MILRLGVGLSACAMLGACGGGKDRPAVAAPATDWRRVATVADRDRLRTWRDAWVSALGKVRGSGNGAAIAAEGALFEPDRALAGPIPPTGAYRCRVFKLGAHGTAARDYTALPSFACRVDAEGELSSFYKTGGLQRPVGLIFPDGGTRAVFLGTMMLGDEKTALTYGRDAGRDMAGLVERIGERRWRLVLPYPRFESVLDVVEMVPAG